jgi:hypothetical protein
LVKAYDTRVDALVDTWPRPTYPTNIGRYPFYSDDHGNIVVTYVQFDSNIRVLYVFLGFFKNMAQNTQSGKGYAKNHYRAAKTTVC